MLTRRAFLERTSALALALLPERQGRSADVVVRGGTIYDGSGAPPQLADLAIRGDRIQAIGVGLSTAGAAVIEARGLAVAPGFIDIHSHSDFELLEAPSAQSKIRQGVTTEIIGQDGDSIGPWRDGQARPDGRPSDVSSFFGRLRSGGTAVNIASMIGAGTVRRTVIGEDDRPPTDRELAQMQALVADALAHGACGLSSGLEYVPGGFASTDELVALAGPLRGRGLPYASHLRNEDDRLLGALEEAIMIGQRAQVPVHVSHLKAQGQRNWWKADVALGLIDTARGRGMDVTFDRYPYVAYSTGLASLFPLWSRDGGTEAFLARLADPALRARLAVAVSEKVAQLGGWDAVQISSTGSPQLTWARGQRVGTLAGARGQEPFALVVEILVEDRNRSGMVGFGMSEENTERILAHPAGMICSDGSALAQEGPLSQGTPHPRSFGTFPRVLGHYVRDRGLMPLETAIHKMSGMPAQRLGLSDRGLLRPGAYADVVVFDPRTVNDRATFEDPHQYPDGIRDVWVNGRMVLRDGEHTMALPGRALAAERRG